MLGGAGGLLGTIAGYLIRASPRGSRERLPDFTGPRGRARRRPVGRHRGGIVGATVSH